MGLSLPTVDEQGHTILLVPDTQHQSSEAVSRQRRIRSEDLEEVRSQMDAPGMCIAFDLKEVTLVDLDSVCFLGLCESEGAKLLNCPLYIREWISREWHSETKPRLDVHERRNG
jgi:hypothetical protein